MSQFAPVQEAARSSSVQPVGEYLQFTVVAPGVAAGFEPGQFVAVAVGGEESAMRAAPGVRVLRRDAGGEFAGTVQFVVAEHGAGTRWLCSQPTGARLDLVGPLGNPFPLPTTPRPVVLVGGGYGTAPLIPLAERLTRPPAAGRDHHRRGHRRPAVRRTRGAARRRRR